MKKLLFIFILFACSERHITAQVGHFIQEKQTTVSTVSGFSESNYYYTGDGTGPQVNMTGFTYWALVLPNGNSATNNWQYVFGNSNRNNQKVGWMLAQFQGAMAGTIGGEFTGQGTAYDKDQCIGTYEYFTKEYNHIQVIHAVVRNGVIYMYKNGIIRDVGTGFTKTTSAFDPSIYGVSIGAFPNSDGTSRRPYETSIIACGVVSGAGLTSQQIYDHYTAILSNIYATPPGATHLWRAADAGATWVDTISGLSATRFGTPTVTHNRAIPYYWPAYNPAYQYGSTDVVLPQLPNTLGSLDVGCIGDSFTIGGHVSYRYQCEINKVVDGISNLRWIGPVQNTDYFNDAYHAYGGTSACSHLNGTELVPYPITTYLATFHPDVVIMWFAVNGTDEQCLFADWLTLIRTIHAAEPNCRFLVIGTPFPHGYGGAYWSAKYQTMAIWEYTTMLNTLKKEGIIIRLVQVDDILNYKASVYPIPEDNHPMVPSPVSDMEGYNLFGARVRPALRHLMGYQ